MRDNDGGMTWHLNLLKQGEMSMTPFCERPRVTVAQGDWRECRAGWQL